MYEIHRRPGAYRVNLTKREREYFLALLMTAGEAVADHLGADRDNTELKKELRFISKLTNKLEDSEYGSGLEDSGGY